VKKIIGFLFSIAFTAHAGLSRLEAISMIETGNNDQARGCAGEVSRYQLLPRVWRCYTNSLAYQDAEVSAWVARQHLNYLESWFYRQTGRPATDFELYVLWNAGPAYFAKKAFRAAAVNPIIRERAGRFVNLRTANETHLQYVIHEAAP
jgi:hypothetical protein